MSTEEPAWKSAFKHAIYMASYNAIPTVDEVLEHLLPHIQAAEERGRREAAMEIRDSVETWDGMSEYAAACMGGKAAAADLIDPDKT